MMKKLVVLILSVCVLGAVPERAHAQTAASFNYFYNGETGSLFAVVNLNKRCAGVCTVTFAGEVHYVGDTTSRVSRTFRKRSILNKKSFQVVLGNLPGVDKLNGILPVLTLQAKVTKGRNISATSDAVARYVHCGSTVQSVSPTVFLNRVSSKFNSASIL